MDSVDKAVSQVPVVAEISAAELLDRITRARDWASSEAERHYALVEQHVQDDASPVQALAQQARAAAFEAVRVVLEEIIQPGTHTA
ncbi:hypothetical protein [Streptacidiphilus cavernicola]|uniref:Uncharacterized protein n=1 Tax=Streptacidiphilus cavernicola TaxID=3342716 RepID=A0ABV6VNS6_9ACTN